MKIIYDNTHNKDMFYAVKVHIPDAFFLVDNGEKRYIFLDRREIDAFLEERRDSSIEVVPLEPLIKEASEIEEDGSLSEKLAFVIFSKYNPENKEVEVPVSFPLHIADFLRKKNIGLKPTFPFFSKREEKEREERDMIKESMRRTVLAFEKIEEVLKESVIKGDSIIYKGKPLTSEFLKDEVKKLLFFENMENPEGMIISSGVHSAFPHHPGKDKLKAHSTIICDIFPRCSYSKYFGDMTRTYVKGKPSKKIEEIYNTVLEAQETALESLKPGETGDSIHKKVCEVFRSKNYEEGFIHGTGHGLGLDVHEGPYIKTDSKDVLKPGHVFTIEPGLYYPDIGGVRIEDLVYITENGAENLTNYHKNFIIK